MSDLFVSFCVSTFVIDLLQLINPTLTLDEISLEDRTCDTGKWISIYRSWKYKSHLCCVSCLKRMLYYRWKLTQPLDLIRYGPRQLKKAAFSRNGTLNCEFKFSTFSCTKRRSQLKVNHHQLSSIGEKECR